MTPDPDDLTRESGTVVEGDAVELPGEPAPGASETPFAAPAPPVYEPEPFAARAYAAPAAAAPAGAGASSSGSGWPDAGIDLAENPEYLVGAAFAGGLLLALILRKLGN